MKTELDGILKKNNVEALFVIGAGMHNPSMVYLAGLAHFSDAVLIQRVGREGILFHSPIEAEEAAKSGLPLRSFNDYPILKYLQEANGDRATASALRYRQMLEDSGVDKGRVAVFGTGSLQSIWPVFSTLQNMLPDISFIGDLEGLLLSDAMMTKSAAEIGRIQKMGEVTARIVENTRDFLGSHRAAGGRLVKANQEPLTIGDVRSRIQLLIAEEGVEAPEGFIFAIGKDAGSPHSIGTASDPIELGKPIVYDIYPCEGGGGYFYDMTRTWCVGHANDATQAAYDQVKQVYEKVVSELKPDTPFRQYQDLTCDLFEAMGHETIRANPKAMEGYIHTLGHGVGLNIHERPFSGQTARPEDILKPGVVFTIEPGLYYPSRDLGVRLEDTYYVSEAGEMNVVVQPSLDLVIPVKGS